MSFFKKLFSGRKKCLAYTATGKEIYFAAVNVLKNNNIAYRVKRLSNHSSTPGIDFVAHDYQTPEMYEFYAKEEDHSKAQHLLTKL
ncbi:hypothetical protein M1K46_21105 [Fictibacillus sp. WQ 8-8]|uniref:hypothetical protein n=1 Tax=Fictibacillus sp. WQ 8-8 TaxID=2938788 RepID=UPI00210C4075|nr:hypothetical protein [Fictibacillus sp. WQ 8-8]MCQ6268121.1 hypothetical protein [Fictibacillus sp. WQ 8-8]